MNEAERRVRETQAGERPHWPDVVFVLSQLDGARGRIEMLEEKLRRVREAAE